jgi:DNA-binding LacI/PurR family transcriptional regulator
MAVANVKEIAKGLSLSPGTVSKALRGTPGLVSVETAHQVLNYCTQRGYLNRLEAGRVMLQIKSRSTGSQVFALTRRTGVGAYDEVFAGICETMQTNELFSSCYMIRDENSLKKFPYDRAEAVIIIGKVESEIHKMLIEHEVPLVLVDDRVAGSKASAVNSNNLEAVSQSVRILAEAGHQHIAFMCRH